MGNVAILPYSVGGNGRYRPRGVADWFFDRMVSEGTLGAVFFDGSVKSKDDFDALLSGSTVASYAGYYGGGLSFFFWLDRFEHRTAYIHFGAAKAENYRNAIKIGEAVISHVFQRSSGAIDMLIARIPTRNKQAIRCVELFGGHRCGTLPFGVWLDDEKRMGPAEIMYFTRR